MTSYFIILLPPVYTSKSRRAPVLPDRVLSSHLSVAGSKFPRCHYGKRCDGFLERAFEIPGVAANDISRQKECSRRQRREEFFPGVLRACSFQNCFKNRMSFS